MFLKSLRGVFAFTARPVGVLWDTGAASGEPAASGSTSSGSEGTSSGTPSPTPSSGTPASGTPAAGAQPAAGTSRPSFTYNEDRGRWVPPHRIVEETRKREGLEAQLQQANARIAALAGVTPKDATQQEAEAIREAFFALPGMAHFRELTPEMVQGLIRLSREGQGMTEATRNYWDRHADSQFAALGEAVADKLGVDTLSERQSRNLNAAFVQWLRSDAENLKPRYDRGDPKLIEEFVKDWADDFIEPARRAATARNIPAPVRVPRGGSSAPVTQGAPQIDYTNPDAVEAEAVRRMKEAGLLQER